VHKKQIQQAVTKIKSIIVHFDITMIVFLATK